MNKYQEAINEIKKDSSFKYYLELSILQELVDKSTPEKITKETIVTGLHDDNKTTYKCPHCKKHFNNVAIKKMNYCYHCGGRLE